MAGKSHWQNGVLHLIQRHQEIIRLQVSRNESDAHDSDSDSYIRARNSSQTAAIHTLPEKTCQHRQAALSTTAKPAFRSGLLGAMDATSWAVRGCHLIKRQSLVLQKNAELCFLEGRWRPIFR